MVAIAPSLPNTDEKMVLLALTDGEYRAIPTSIALPIVTAAVLENWRTQATTLGETTWVKAIRRWASAIA